MFAELRAKLAAIQLVHERLPDAAIAVATEVRGNVRRRHRAAGKRRRAQKVELRLKGYSPAQVRAALARGRRKGSGISIDGRASGDGVVLTASDQVQYFRRAQGETADLVEILRKHLHVAESWRRRKGGR